MPCNRPAKDIAINSEAKLEGINGDVNAVGRLQRRFRV